MWKILDKMKTKILISAMWVLSITASAQWTTLDDGLQVMDYSSPVKSDIGNSMITVLKIDPGVYKFEILMGGWLKDKSVKDWCKKNDKVAAINAGMFTEEGRNCGYMISNGRLNGKENRGNAIFAFDGDGLPVQIVDRQCQEWSEMKPKYQSATQSIRMVDCNQHNVWTPQSKRWSVACLAMDKSGNVLMIHCRSAYTMHDFIDILLSGPFDIYNMMYLEGGPEAQLYVNAGGREIIRIGSYETGFYESDENDVYWQVPNVIAISKK